MRINTVSDIMRLTVPQVGSTTPGHSAVQRSNITQRIETVVDWDLVVKKYRTLVGREEEIVHDNQINLVADK